MPEFERDGGRKQDTLEKDLQPFDVPQMGERSKGRCVADDDGHGALRFQALEAFDLLGPVAFVQSQEWNPALQQCRLEIAPADFG